MQYPLTRLQRQVRDANYKEFSDAYNKHRNKLYEDPELRSLDYHDERRKFFLYLKERLTLEPEYTAPKTYEKGTRFEVSYDSGSRINVRCPETDRGIQLTNSIYYFSLNNFNEDEEMLNSLFGA